MKYRKLGNSGIEVSAIGFGAWAIGGNMWGSTDDRESTRALQKAFELGVTFFDTADVYGLGHSETLLAKALGDHRDKIVIASKVGNDFYNAPSDTPPGQWPKNFARDHVLWAVEQSLRRLGTDYIDIYQLHNPPMEVIVRGEVFDAMEVLKKFGKIRHYGISIGPSSEGISAINRAAIASVQVVYNLLQREPERELFKACEMADVGVVARVPLASGLLTGKFTGEETFPANDHRSRMTPEQWRAEVARVAPLRFLERRGQTLAQAALRFALAHPAVSTVIPGAKTAMQVIENVKAGEGELTAEELERIRGAGPTNS